MKINAYTGPVSGGHTGRSASAETKAIRSALEESAKTGQMFKLDGVPEAARRKLQQRVRAAGTALALSVSIQYAPDGDLVVSAKRKAGSEPEAAAPIDEVTLPAVTLPTTPKRTSRKATTPAK